MKKWIALALSLTLALGLTACGGQKADETPANDDAALEAVDEAAAPDDSAAPETTDDSAAPETTDDSAAPDDAASPDDSAATPDDSAEPDVSVANPFTDYATYAEAEAAAGFAFGVPEEIGGYDTVHYRVADDLSLFEVIYENDASSLTARKAPGGWNISGDSNQYTQEVAETLQGVNVTCWGDGESLFLAMWTVDDYSYSLGATESMDRMDFLGAVETIIALNA